MGGSGVIRLEQYIAQPPERVWKALTEPELLQKWWAAGDVRPVVGHRFALDMGAFGQQPCEVLVVEPGQVFSYSFGGGPMDTTITWRLKPSGEGTDLTLEHAGFDLDSEMGERAYQGMRAGWPSILGRIESVLAESAPA